MGEWLKDAWLYDAVDIRQILDYGRSGSARGVFEAIDDRADVERAMKALKIKRGLFWLDISYQAIADYLSWGE